MATPVHIKGGPADYKATVTSLGQLITAPFAYDTAVFKELAVANTAYNFYPSRSGWQFVITGIRAKADRDVSNTADADVVIYEAGSEDTTMVDKTLHQEAMIRGESMTLIPINILVAAGKYVNAKTTDDDIHMTIFGYYIPAL